MAQMVKNLPAMQEARLQSLSWEDLLEKEMATHSSILAWRIPWTEEPGGLYSPWGCKRVRQDWATNTLFNFSSKEQTSFIFMAAVTIRSDFRAQENKICHCFHFFPFYCREVMGTDAMVLVLLMLSFKPAFSLLSFTLKRLFISSSLSAIRVISSAYLRLLIFLPATLITACPSSSPAFHMMYSA